MVDQYADLRGTRFTPRFVEPRTTAETPSTPQTRPAAAPEERTLPAPYVPMRSWFEEQHDTTTSYPLDTPARGPAIMLIGAAVLALVGTFLPWATVTADSLSESINGFASAGSDGWYVLAIALFLLVAEAINLSTGREISGRQLGGNAIFAAALTYISLVDASRIGDIGAKYGYMGVSTSLGVGLLFEMLAAGLLIWGVIWRWTSLY